MSVVRARLVIELNADEAPLDLDARAAWAAERAHVLAEELVLFVEDVMDVTVERID